MPSCQLGGSTGQKRQNWYDLVAYTLEANGVVMYCGSYVINLFKQKIVSQKNDIFDTVAQHNNIFLSQTLWPSSLHKSSIHICIEKRYSVSTVADENVHVQKKMFSTKYHAQATWTVLLDWSFAMGALQ